MSLLHTCPSTPAMCFQGRPAVGIDGGPPRGSPQSLNSKAHVKQFPHFFLFFPFQQKSLGFPEQSLRWNPEGKPAAEPPWVPEAQRLLSSPPSCAPELLGPRPSGDKPLGTSEMSHQSQCGPTGPEGASPAGKLSRVELNSVYTRLGSAGRSPQLPDERLPRPRTPPAPDADRCPRTGDFEVNVHLHAPVVLRLLQSEVKV